MRKRIKTPKIDKSRHWLEMDYDTRKHVIRALNAARRAVRLERLAYMAMMDARRDDERITWQGLWQSRKRVDAMQRTVAELERMLVLADGENRPSASDAVADEFLDMVDEHEEGRVLE
jgi:hypothetical protein